MCTQNACQPYGHLSDERQGREYPLQQSTLIQHKGSCMA
uniref:Uncharacterized protein n=1 Tax=Arundo donax TaxID=35708 RepID=A0A0A8XSC2_ARUDO